MVAVGKKLLVLDVNGLLIDTYFQAEQRPDRPHDAKLNRFYVYKRNGCEDFVQFCLDNFVVGVWSSAREHNVVSFVEFMFKESKDKLAFVWHQMHCTDTKLRHPENKYKPVFLKELSKLWDKSDPDLPWEKGDFGPSNTVLIDDSPYKALRNPPHTGIFPETYKAADTEDNYLVGELRKYLEGIVRAADVQLYIEKNPFGMPRLTHDDQHYHFFSSVMDMAEIPALPVKPAASLKHEETMVAVANTAGDLVVALPDSDAFATSHRRRGKRRFGNTAEESLEYCATERVQSPRDFAERLSRAVDASVNDACERDPLGGASPPVADGILGRPPSLGRSLKIRDTFFDKDRDRSHRRQPGRREGPFHGPSQRRDHADARYVQYNSPGGRRTSVIYVDGQWSRGGLQSEQDYNQKSVGGKQWSSAGLDPQRQYRGHIGAIDMAKPNRGSREWEGLDRGWDLLDVDNRHRGMGANHHGRLSAERSWRSPAPPYVEFNSRARVHGGATKHLDGHRRRGWSGDSRSSHGGLSPYTGRPRDREGFLKDQFVDRGRPRDREPVYREARRDPEFPLRAGLRALENPYNLASVEHEVTGGAGRREHEDFDGSYARPFSHHDGYARGRPREVFHDQNRERVRGKSRHQEDVGRNHQRQSYPYDIGVGVSNSIPHSEYDTYRDSDKVRKCNERVDEDFARSRSRNWRDTEKVHSGPSESHVRRDNDIAGRSARMSSRHYERAHSRVRNWNSWER